MPSTLNEARVILALEAIQNDKDLSIRAAAKIYGVPVTTIRRRLAGRPIRRDIPANLRSLTDLEEQTILSIRAFSPRLYNVKDMANHLVFYKELEEGACKIVDGNMILLA
ncbi:hypothetical protein B0T18DRAFT_417741 [Schizothecium vesticola]|uniref:HTH psq-type domain-containing protein n=1 Tax=Schizothecium vesticola TaxID=314040 RepID=A0AA40JYS5_9PEZI|nr:hypothetical protein B0T18DRAFT_417741 [Schizothecium vesticola]